MTNGNGISRRRFLGAGAAVVGAAAIGPVVPAVLAANPRGKGERLVPPGLFGIQHWSIRDAVSRRSIASSLAAGLQPTMGYLGGPSFPEDPTDLGPLVPLPGGYIEVFAFLASHGYRGFEFFQLTQNSNEFSPPRQPTVAEIRSYLDNAGLSGQGNHQASLGAMFDPAANGGAGGLSATGLTHVANAHVLGLPMLGTAGDPSGRNTLANNPTNPNQIGYAEAARRANIVGQALAAEGLKWYWHVEQNGYNGFDPAVHPELAGINRMQWFFDNTDPGLVFVEPDTFHAYAGRARFPFPDGSLFDIVGWWMANAHRNVAWHVKDGTRVAPQPAPPTNPFTQNVVRPGFPLGTGTDALYIGEGTIGQGYPVDPDPAVIGFRTLFDDVPGKGDRFYMTESDGTQGGSTDPGRSLRHARLAAQYLLGLRAGPNSGATAVVAAGVPTEGQESHGDASEH